MSQTEVRSSARTYTGSCHCGAVRYEIELDLSEGVTACNCSVCQKLGGVSKGTNPEAFRVVKGRESLGEYRVGDSPNSRSFCRSCGIHLFGQGDVPELGGAFVSVRVNTLDDVEVGALKVMHWDGRHDNWAAGLRPEPWPVLR